MKWTEENIEKKIRELANDLNIKRMPTSTEMRLNRMTGLSRAIGLTGGMYKWSGRLRLPMKKRVKKWNDEAIEKGIKNAIRTLCINRMPTSNELKSIRRADLQNAITKNGGFRYWAERLNHNLKISETLKGVKYEDLVTETLRGKDFDVTIMSNGHPYDLLIDGNVKVDVKSGTEHYHFGSRAHTFRPSSKHSTCDIYICLALKKCGEVENTFVIPSKFAKVQTINVGADSKYNKFIDRWEYLDEYSTFYRSVIS